MNFTQPSNLRAAMKTGKILLGVSVALPSVETAKKVAMTGYDWTFIDVEHAPFSPVMLADIIHAFNFYSQGKTMPVVRVPPHEPSYIGNALDAGAAGIVLPHTETKEDVDRLIDNCRFPPLGKRSYPPWSWIPGINDQVPPGHTLTSMINEHIAVIAQIESKKGVENAEEIISTDGVDAVMIGLGDLRLDMGLEWDWNPKEPEYLAALDKIEGLARKYNKPLVGFAYPDIAPAWEDRVRRGYQLILCASDTYTLTYALAANKGKASASIAEIRAAMAKEREEEEKGAVAKDKVVNSNGQAVDVS